MSTNKEILQNYNTRLEAIKTTLEQSCVELATPVLNVDEGSNKVRAEITQPAGIITQPKKPFTYTITPTVPGAEYGFELNGDGYWESKNGAAYEDPEYPDDGGDHDSAAICRVNLNVNQTCNITFKVINYAESDYDYGVFGNLDTELELDHEVDYDGDGGESTDSYYKSFRGLQSPDEVDVVYYNIPAGEHFIDVKFRKDTSVDEGNDSIQFKIVEPAGPTIPFAYSDWMDLPDSCDHTSVTRASTTMSVSANDTSDTITVTASNNQETGLVQGSNATASKTFTLTTSGKTATVSDGTYSISKNVTTATRASTTISIPAGTSTSFTATAGNNQSTGYVTGSNKTATQTVYLRENGATVEAASATSGGTVYGKKTITSGSLGAPTFSRVETTDEGHPLSLMLASTAASSGYITAGTGSTFDVTTNIPVTSLSYPASIYACTYAGSGSCAATGTNITLGSKTTSAPTSGPYIKVTGSGTVNMNPGNIYRTDGGYGDAYILDTDITIPAGSARSSNTATAYYPITKVTLGNGTVTLTVKNNRSTSINVVYMGAQPTSLTSVTHQALNMGAGASRSITAVKGTSIIVIGAASSSVPTVSFSNSTAAWSTTTGGCARMASVPMSTDTITVS